MLKMSWSNHHKILKQSSSLLTPSSMVSPNLRLVKSHFSVVESFNLFTSPFITIEYNIVTQFQSINLKSFLNAFNYCQTHIATKSIHSFLNDVLDRRSVLKCCPFFLVVIKFPSKIYFVIPGNYYKIG